LDAIAFGNARIGLSSAARRGILLAALVASAALHAAGEPSWLVVSRPDGEELAALELRDGRFEHVFVHSFHLTPVRERFRVERGEEGGAVLRLYELRYQSSGVGMPEGPELGYRLEDGVFIVDMDRSFASIPLRVSIVEGHGVTVEGVYRPFTEWAAPEKGLVLTGRMGRQQDFGGRGQ
jgi:hypothetical protein